MPFRVKKFFERVGPSFAFSYQPGMIIDATCMDHERLVRQGFLEVFGEDAAERKIDAVSTDEEPAKRGRPRKAAIA